MKARNLRNLRNLRNHLNAPPNLVACHHLTAAPLQCLTTTCHRTFEPNLRPGMRAGGSRVVFRPSSPPTGWPALSERSEALARAQGVRRACARDRRATEAQGQGQSQGQGPVSRNSIKTEVRRSRRRGWGWRWRYGGRGRRGGCLCSGPRTVTTHLSRRIYHQVGRREALRLPTGYDLPVGTVDPVGEGQWEEHSSVKWLRHGARWGSGLYSVRVVQKSASVFSCAHRDFARAARLRTTRRRLIRPTVRAVGSRNTSCVMTSG